MAKEVPPTVGVSAAEVRWSRVNIADINEFGKMLELIDNRVKVINQMLGYSRVGARDNPMRLVMDHGKYLVKLGDSDIVSFGIYDLVETKQAISVIDGMNDGIWCALREGYLRVA